jgi:uncharacterized protein YciI
MTMKYFLIEITYTAPLVNIDETLPLHRAFLQTGYDKGWLLMSGPKNPRVGGVVIGRAPSQEHMEEFFKNDPYNQRAQATYRIVEFDPVKRAAILESWLN